MGKARGPELLIDGDIVLYRAICAAQVDQDWGDGQMSRYCDVDEAKQLFDVEIASLLEHVGTKRYRLALSDRNIRWRQQVLPTYKGNRAEPKPLGFWELFDYAVEVHKGTIMATLEGDDVLGIWATHPRGRAGKIVFSTDKDMRGVPCNLLSDWRGPVVEITEDEADRFHLFQTLMGDRTDGYAGVPGIGKVRAEKILGDLAPADRWPAVLKAYEAADLRREDALVQAQVARILRHGEYNARTGAVRRWQP